MSWVKNFIKDLKRILNIESDRERLDQYDQLAYNIVERPKVKKMVRGYNWVYFYPVISYDNEGNEVLGEQLGKISSEIYNKHKKEIEKLRKAGKIEELKNFFEK